MSTLSELKKLLLDCGLSTSTPGLDGNDRFIELQQRYRNYQKNTNCSIDNDSPRKDEVVDASLENMTMNDIKSKLLMYGEDISTPSVSGEDRRKVLLTRLKKTISATNEYKSPSTKTEEKKSNIHVVENDSLSSTNTNTDTNTNMTSSSSSMNKFASKFAHMKNTSYQYDIDQDNKNDKNDGNNKSEENVRSTLNIITNENLLGSNNEEMNTTGNFGITVIQVEELKKQLKMIQNKRATMIASKFAGNLQDLDLKNLEIYLKKVDKELIRIRSIQNKNPTQLVSSILIDTNGKLINCDRVLSELEYCKYETTEKIKQRRIEIREEIENDPKYGKLREEQLTTQLLEYNFEVNKTKRETNLLSARLVTPKAGLGRNSYSRGTTPSSASGSPFRNIGTGSFTPNNIRSTPNSVNSSPNAKANNINNNDDIGNNVFNTTNSNATTTIRKAKLNTFTTTTTTTQLNSPMAPPSTPINNLFVSSIQQQQQQIEFQDKIKLAYNKIIEEEDEDDDEDDEDEEENKVAVKNELHSKIRDTWNDGDKQNRNGDTSANVKDTKYNNPKDYAKGEDYARVNGTQLGTKSKSVSNTIRNTEASTTNKVIKPRQYYDLDHDVDDDVDDDVGYVTTAKNISNTNTTTTTTSRSMNNAISSTTKKDSFHEPLGNKKVGKGRRNSDIENNDDEDNNNDSDDDSKNSDNNNDDDDEEEDEDKKEKKLIKRYHKQFKILANIGDYDGAEELLEKTIQLNPLDIRTLNYYAVFLHQKKGELARAEAFFIRGLQVCMPQFVEDIITNPTTTTTASTSGLISTTPTSLSAENKENVINIPPPIPDISSSTKIKAVVNLLINYSRFLTRAKGDMDLAEKMYRKVIEIQPGDPITLASFAHFLSGQGSSAAKQEAKDLFIKAMKMDPNNIQTVLWYAKLLKKMNAHAQAELMYLVAVENSKNNIHYEPLALCNYASFLYKYRKNKDKALPYFKQGIEKYPQHKGLLKNFTAFLKSNSEYGKLSDYIIKTTKK